MGGLRARMAVVLAGVVASLAACAGLLGVDDIGYGGSDAGVADTGGRDALPPIDATDAHDAGVTTSPFCPADGAAHTLCEDFDEGADLTLRWFQDVNGAGSGIGQAQDASFSPPGAFRSFWSSPGPLPPAQARAQIVQHYPSLSKVAVSFRLNLAALVSTDPLDGGLPVDARILGIGQWNLFFRKTPNGTSAFVSTFDKNQFVPDASGDLFFTSPARQAVWSAVTVEVTFGPTGGYTVSVVQPGGATGTLVRGGMPAVAKNTEVDVAFGAQVDQGYDQGAMFLDDIVIDVVP
jgi:hypothetical protein